MNDLKCLAPAIVAFMTVMFIHWASGDDFERSNDMAASIIFGIIAGIVAYCLKAMRIEEENRK